MPQPNEEWLNEGTPEGCQYFLFTLIAYGLSGLGFLVGLVIFVIAVLTQFSSGKFDFWATLALSLAFWLGFSLIGLVFIWLRRRIRLSMKDKNKNK